jgi:transposase
MIKWTHLVMIEVAVVDEVRGIGAAEQQLRFETVGDAPSAQRVAADDSEVGGAPRLRMANRQQVRLEAVDLDSRIEPDHPARAIWRVLEPLNLVRFYQPIKALEGKPGQDATDPRILIALWLYAISEGVSSAREIARLCERHDAYRWLCGGVSVNHHMISDFRKDHGDALDDLFSQVLGVLMHKRLVSLHRIAQDGMRVRASAGAASFHREPTLQRCLDEAKARVAELQAQAEQNDPERSARVKAAQERAARQREARVEQALKELEQIQATKATAKNHPQRKTETRVSTTDPDARRMKMANGGYNPAYNLQFATDTESRVIVALRASNDGNDNHQLKPMLDQIKAHTHRLPGQILLDGGYMNFAAIEDAAARGIEVFAPLRQNKDYHIDPYAPQPGDSSAIIAYRQRMASAEGKEIYKQRAATAETINADLRTWRGLGRLLLRGTAKVLIAARWSALTYNILRGITMGWL